jgi:Spy/CpxP family protein refolding chaperone
MARHIAWVVGLLLLVPASGLAAGSDELCERSRETQQRVGPPPPAGAKPDKPGPDRPKWWIDAKLRVELSITDQQSAAVEQVWQKSLPYLRDGHQRLQTLEDSLSQLTDTADETAVIAQIERVENLRAELSKARTLMIYRMNKLLTADQRAKVKTMYEHRDPPRRGSSLE